MTTEWTNADWVRLGYQRAGKSNGHFLLKIAELESQLRESNAKLAGIELALEAAEKLASHFEQEAATYKTQLLELEGSAAIDRVRLVALEEIVENLRKKVYQ